MNNDFEKDKVLSRVKKMLALANDAGASEGERDNALRMAHATLAKYNLSMSDADSLTTEEPRTKIDVTLKDSPWRRSVANAVAKLFFCNLIVTNLGKSRYIYHFIGKESNAFTAKEMSQYVADSIYKEATRAAKGQPDPTYHRSFCKGAGHRVYVRCEEIRRSAEQMTNVPASNGTALVLSSVYRSEEAANRALIESMYGKVRSSKNKERGANWGAYSAGQQYGDKIGLHRQVGSGGGSNNGLLK